MMRRAVLLALLALPTPVAAVAAEVLPPGSVYGTKEGCAAVASGKYPESDDWSVVTGKYLSQHESFCEFVQTLPDQHGSLFVNAICSSDGTWPATFAITKGEGEGSLLVSESIDDPLELHVCQGQTAAAADKLFGE